MEKHSFACEHLLRVLGYAPMLGGRHDNWVAQVEEALAAASAPSVGKKTYRLRAMCPKELAALTGPLDEAKLRQVLPGLIAAHVNLFAEKMTYGQPLSESAMQRLAAACRRLEGLWGADHPALAPLQKAVMGQRRIVAWCSRDLYTGLPKAEIAVHLREVAENAAGFQRFAAVALRFLDRTAGMFRLLPLTGGQNKGQFFVDPIVLLALIEVACRSSVDIPAPAATYTRTPPSSESGLLEYLNFALAVPDLPGPLAPEKPAAVLAEALEAARGVIRAVPLPPGVRRLRVQLGTPGARFCLLVRHDIDRPLRKAEVNRICSWESQRRILSAWFFKPETWIPSLAVALAERGLAIGWHACHAHIADHGFPKVVKQLLRAPAPFGCTFHGGQDASFWYGLSTIRAVAAAGVQVAERLDEWLPHPYPCPQTGVVLMPQPVKIESRPAWTEEHAELVRHYGGLMVVENHPDRWTIATEKMIGRWIDEGACAVSLLDVYAAITAPAGQVHFPCARVYVTDDV